LAAFLLALTAVSSPVMAAIIDPCSETNSDSRAGCIDPGNLPDACTLLQNLASATNSADRAALTCIPPVPPIPPIPTVDPCSIINKFERDSDAGAGTTTSGSSDTIAANLVDCLPSVPPVPPVPPVPDACAIVRSVTQNVYSRAQTNLADCIPPVPPIPHVPTLDELCASLLRDDVYLDSAVPVGCSSLDCVPSSALAAAAMQPSTGSAPGTLGAVVSDAERMRMLDAAYLMGGTPDLAASPEPSRQALAALLASGATASSAQDLLLQVTGAASVDDVPTGVLVFTALTAAPAGSPDEFFAAGYGGQWGALLADRYAKLSSAILVQDAALPTFTVTGHEWPTTDALVATAGLREQRGEVGAALLYFGLHQADEKGTLAASLTYLGRTAAVAQSDFSAVSVSRAAASPSAGTAAVADCPLVDALAALAAQALQDVLDLVDSIPPLVDSLLAWLVPLFEGEWYDGLMGLSGATASLSSVIGFDLNGAVGQNLGDVQHGEDPVQALFHSAYVLSSVLVGEVARDISEDTAVTDLGEQGEWKVAIMKTVTSATGYSWNIPGVNLAMDQGVLSTVDESPTVFSEGGHIWQSTSNSHTILVLDWRQPGWTANKDYYTLKCELIRDGTALVVLGAVAAGFAAAATAPPTAGGSVVVWMGVAAAAAGTVALAVANAPDCFTPITYDDGFFHEEGVYTNYWTDFGWSGSGMTVGGLVSIYGTTTQTAAAPALHETPYTNADHIRGYDEGLEAANARRTLAEGVSNHLLSEFRGVASLAGDAHITIEILCESPYALAASVKMDASLPIAPGSNICLRVLVGNASTGSVGADENGAKQDIITNSDGVSGSGYVTVNGQTVPSPVVLDFDGTGQNVIES
jgi:hypothetical protein